MALITSWEQRGIEQGIDLGKCKLIALLVHDRFGEVPDNTKARLERLTSAQYDDLCRALLHFDTLADLDGWLSQN